MPLRYSIERCRVADKDKLRQFRKIRSKWIRWLRGPIRRQLYTLMWDDAVYRMINEARRMAFQHPTNRVGFNGPTSNLLDRGFVTSQLMAIRRLVDRRRDVISIPRLLKEINEHRHLITREMYVCYDGLPYDYSTVCQKFLDTQVFQNGVSKMQGIPASGPKAWLSSEQLHEHFDKLSGKQSEERSKSDLIRRGVISGLAERLNASSDLEKAANELFAHIPDHQRGSKWSRKRFRITLNKLRGAQRSVCQVVHLIDSSLLWESSSSIIPTPQYDYLEDFDKAWATTGRLEKLHEFWEAHERDTEQWTNLKWP